MPCPRGSTANIANYKPVRRYKTGVCTTCKRTHLIYARGKCQVCYKRLVAAGVTKRNPLYTEPAYARLPDAPTTAIPGTPEKLKVIHERARAKRQLFHPFDAKFYGDPAPLKFLAVVSLT